MTGYSENKSETSWNQNENILLLAVIDFHTCVGTKPD